MNSQASTREAIQMTNDFAALDAEAFAEALRRLRTPPASESTTETCYSPLTQSGARQTADYRLGAGASV